MTQETVTPASAPALGGEFEETGTPTRRAVIGAAALLATAGTASVAAGVAGIAATPTGADAEILARFREYRRAVAACNAEAYDEEDEVGIAFLEAARAMDALPPPVTIAGVVVMLRFAFTNLQPDKGWLNATIHAEPAERAAYYRENWSDLDDDAPHIAAAILALEAMEV